MNKPASKLTLIISMLAIGSMFAIPAVSAQDDKEAKKKAQMEKALKKYDKNKNGKLDPEEKAEQKADAEKKKKKG